MPHLLQCRVDASFVLDRTIVIPIHVVYFLFVSVYYPYHHVSFDNNRVRNARRRNFGLLSITLRLPFSAISGVRRTQVANITCSGRYLPLVKRYPRLCSP